MNEAVILNGIIKPRDFIEFLKLYDAFHEDLLIYAFLVLRDESAAKKAVHTAFEKLWLNPEMLDQPIPLYSIVFREVKFIVHFLKYGINL